jgi:hypothetical protein
MASWVIRIENLNVGLKLFSAFFSALITLLSIGSAQADEFLVPPFDSDTTRESAKETVVSGGRIRDLMVDLETFENLRLAKHYKAESAPGGRGELQTNMHHYVLNYEGSPILDILERLHLPFSFNFHRNTSVLVAQYHHKGQVAARALRVSDLPFTAKIASERLRAGDLMAFTADMDLSLSATWAVTVFPGLAVGPSIGVLVSGLFKVYLLKMNDNHIRARFVAVNGRNNNFGIQVGPSIPIGGALKLVGVSVVNSIGSRKLGITPLEFSVKTGESHYTVADYVFNLDDPEAARVYDKFMGANLKLTDLPYRNPLDAPRFAKKRFHDLVVVEKIATQDEGLAVKKRRIKREVLLTAASQSFGGEVRLDIGLFDFGTKEMAITNHIVAKSQNGNAQRYLLKTHTSKAHNSFIFGLQSNEEFHEMSVLSIADSRFQPKGIRFFSFVTEQKLTPFQVQDIQGVRRYFQQVLPAKAVQHLNWRSSAVRPSDNGFIRTEFSFQPEILRRFVSRNPQVIAGQLMNYLRGKDLSDLTPFYAPMALDYGSAMCQVMDCLTTDVGAIAELLARGMNSRVSNGVTTEDLRQLMGLELFQKYGPGFFASLLPAEELSSMEVNFILSSEGSVPYHFKYGSVSEGELYQTVSRLQGIGDPRVFPVRVSR